jgi:hypothetical protein
MPLPVRYHFSQRFPVSAKKAFNWCTDFNPDDYVLMGEEGVERHITHIIDSTIILKDIFHSAPGQVEKQKLVQLYPDQLLWVSTHLTGSNKYSQFLYVISPKGKDASILSFTASHVDYEKKTSDKTDAKLLAYKLRTDDANAWKLLAKAMTKELVK